MSTTFFDTLDTDQNSNSTIPYSATWSPESTRQLLASSGNISITLSRATFSGTASTTFSGEIIYTFSTPQDFSMISSFVFEGLAYYNSSATITILTNNNLVATYTLDGPTLGNIYVDVSSPPSTATNTLTIRAVENSTPDSTLIFANITSDLVCVASGSMIKTLTGEKRVQDIQRGEEIEGGKVARLIKQEISPHALIQAVIFSPGSLDGHLPTKKLIVCANHYLIYKNKKRLAKSFLAFPGVYYRKTKASEILPQEEDGKYYFYDIQYDHEGEYVVNGLKSQSRSPWAMHSPLPKELYFVKDRYKEIRVKNTLFNSPPESFYYLLPDGREVESLMLIKTL